MAFDNNSIKNYIKDANEYEKGISYIEADGVKLFPNRSIFRGEESISGEISDGESKIIASFTLKNGSLVSYGCKCQYFTKNK